MRIIRVSFRQLFHKSRRKMPVYRGIGTCIVPAPEFMTSSLIIGMYDFRISFYHPSGKRCGGGGHDNVIVFPGKHIHDTVKLLKSVFMFGWLYFRPGKNVDGSAVDPGIPKNAHVLLPDFLRPLIWIIIPSIEDPLNFDSTAVLLCCKIIKEKKTKISHSRRGERDIFIR